LAKTNLFRKNPLLRSTRVLCSPACSRVGHCSHHCFCYLRYQETHNHHYAYEKSPSPRSSSLPPRLISNSCPMPKAARSALAKPRERRLTELLHNNLLSHTDPAHNCLTFSDLLSARCSAPPRLCAAPAKKTKAKQDMLRYCPKPKPACINPNLLLLYFAAHPLCPCHFHVPWFPWAEQFHGKHTQAQTNITHNTTKRFKNREDSLREE